MDIAHQNSLWADFLEVRYQSPEIRESPRLLIQWRWPTKTPILNKSRKSNLIADMAFMSFQEQYVWIKNRQAGGAVVEQTDPRLYKEQTDPRLYKVKGLDGEFRQKRRHLVSHPPEETRSAEVDPEDESATQSPGDDSFTQPSSEMHNSSCVCTRTRSRRISRPPEQFNPKWD